MNDSTNKLRNTGIIPTLTYIELVNIRIRIRYLDQISSDYSEHVIRRLSRKTINKDKGCTF